MAPHGQHAVVILGMHRSGTSAVAGTAVRLGLAPPLTPLPDAADNPGGFYESLPVVNINHQLLRAAGCAWDRCLTFDADAIDAMLSDVDRRIIVEVLQRECGASTGFVLKDPRLCLTLPAWMPALHEVCSTVSAVIVVRHPAEVVESLARRDRLPASETARHWLHHMLEAERLTRAVPRAVVFYDDLLRDWRRCMTKVAADTAIEWPVPIEAAADEVDRFLAGSQRHHTVAQTKARVGAPEMHDLVNSVWTMFRFMANDPNSPVAQVCLDQARAEFAIWRRERAPRPAPPAVDGSHPPRTMTI